MALRPGTGHGGVAAGLGDALLESAPVQTPDAQACQDGIENDADGIGARVRAGDDLVMGGCGIRDGPGVCRRRVCPGPQAVELPRRASPVLPSLLVLVRAQGEEDFEGSDLGLSRVKLRLDLAKVPRQILREYLVPGHGHRWLLICLDAPVLGCAQRNVHSDARPRRLRKSDGRSTWTRAPSGACPGRP